MKEIIVMRAGQPVTEVRSTAGKLLLVKTREGYEIKCPRSKQICLFPYREIIQDCMRCLQENSNGDFQAICQSMTVNAPTPERGDMQG